MSLCRNSYGVDGQCHCQTLERPLGSEGDLDRLFAVGRHGGAVVGILGEMDDPEPGLGVRLAVSRPAHSGSQHFPARSYACPSGHFHPRHRRVLGCLSLQSLSVWEMRSPRSPGRFPSLGSCASRSASRGRSVASGTSPSLGFSRDAWPEFRIVIHGST